MFLPPPPPPGSTVVQSILVELVELNRRAEHSRPAGPRPTGKQTHLELKRGQEREERRGAFEYMGANNEVPSWRGPVVHTVAQSAPWSQQEGVLCALAFMDV